MHDGEHKRMWGLIAVVILSFGLLTAVVDAGVPQQVEAAARVVADRFGFVP